jgi:hypothetical protein
MSEPPIKTTPTRPGFYWAQWRIIEEGSSTEQDATPSIGTWEVVDVWRNGSDPSSPEYLRVHVPGESKGQPIENFFWGPGPLVPPKGAESHE